MLDDKVAKVTLLALVLGIGAYLIAANITTILSVFIGPAARGDSIRLEDKIKIERDLTDRGLPLSQRDGAERRYEVEQRTLEQSDEKTETTEVPR